MSDIDDERLAALMQEVEVEIDTDADDDEDHDESEEQQTDAVDDDGDDEKPNHSDPDEDDEDEGEPHEEDAERARRREERRRKKENRDRAKQRTIRENRQLNEALRERDRQIESLTKQVAAVAQNMTGANLRAIDQQVAQLEYDFQIVENARQEAIHNNNIADYDKAERVKQALIAKYHEAQVIKQRHVQEMATIPAQPVNQENPHLTKFMKNNPWFKPGDTADKNTQLAMAINNTLLNKGMKDDSPQFWRTLQQEIDDVIDADLGPRQQRQRVGGPKVSPGRTSTGNPKTVRIPKEVTDMWEAAGISPTSDKFKKAARDYYLASKQPK